MLERQQVTELFPILSIFELVPEVVLLRKTCDTDVIPEREKESWKNIFQIYVL